MSHSLYHGKLVSRRVWTKRANCYLSDTSISFFLVQVRVCHDDSDYYSYTEIPIECVSQGLSYTLVQVPNHPPTHPSASLPTWSNTALFCRRPLLASLAPTWQPNLG